MSRSGPTRALWTLAVWSSMRGGGFGPLPVILGIAWIVVPLRAVRHAGAAGPGLATLTADAIVAAPILLCLALVFGRGVLAGHPRLSLLPWSDTTARAAGLVLTSPFAFLACASTTVVYGVGYWTLSTSSATDRALGVAGVIVGGVLTFLACVAAVRSATHRLVSLSFWLAVTGLILLSTTIVRPGAALEFPGVAPMARALAPPDGFPWRTRAGLLLAVGLTLATVVRALRGRPGVPRVVSSGRPVGGALLAALSRRFGPALANEVALMLRARLIRNALVAMGAWAAFSAFVGIPAGLTLVFFFWLQLAFNLFAFDFPGRGVDRHRLQPGGLVAALHRREAAIHAVTATLVLPLVAVTLFTSRTGRFDAVGWVAVGHAAFSVAALLGRPVMLRRPKPLRVEQFFAHGGVLTARGYVLGVLALALTVATAVALYGLVAAGVGSGAVARTLALTLTAVVVGALHLTVRLRERSLGRILWA